MPLAPDYRRLGLIPTGHQRHFSPAFDSTAVFVSHIWILTSIFSEKRIIPEIQLNNISDKRKQAHAKSMQLCCAQLPCFRERYRTDPRAIAFTSGWLSLELFEVM
jgi:hypothetical protein